MRNKNETARISVDVPQEQHRVLKASAALNEVSEEEKWLLEPENAESLKKLERGLAQDGETSWDDIKKRLKL